MARKPRTPKAATNELLNQIRFVGSVLKEQGSPSETHIILSNNWAVAFNGVLAAGTKISSSLFAAVNYHLFEKALAKCGEEYSLSVDNHALVIKSNKFKAIVPCLDPTLINTSGIDAPTHQINDAFKKGLEITGALAAENGQAIHYASILINGQSLVSTDNGVLLIEYWHGCELPTNIAVPKSLVDPLIKTNKKLVGFGHSNNSVTFHFEDESFIKSQLFAEQWPSVDHLLSNECNPFETPRDLQEALNAVGPHSVDNLVYFDTDMLRSHPNDSVGASYSVKGLPRGPIFNIKQLDLMLKHAKQIDFFVQGGKMTYFFGENCRGVVAGRVQ